ncbi:MAG: holo-[acyl-carrier protein] synthase [Frankiaceae bacterium]|nr:holo-[acyl-carrier protein] synthase [Frankiaceae bacterium]MDX6273853.1 holo-[acyl-carrier protein] synthase [Frankiales bacterium]
MHSRHRASRTQPRLVRTNLANAPRATLRRCQTPRVSYRVGIDVVGVHEVQASLDAHGRAYLERVYTPAEQRACASTAGGHDAGRLAQRFAAKEAVRKVIRADLPWTDIEVDTATPPGLRVPDAGWSLFLSLTQASGRAAAVVVGQQASGGVRE